MASRWSILAPIDLSCQSEAAVQYAIGVARSLTADLNLLHVIRSESAQSCNWPSNAWAGLHEPFEIRRRVLRGETAATIADHAEAIDADLVLMVARLYGRWNRFWRRSVTEAVLRLSSRPVCITPAIKPGAAFEPRSRRILVAVELEGNDAALAYKAQEVALRTASELILLHVVPEPNEGLLHYVVEHGRRPLSRERADDGLRHLAAALCVPATPLVRVGSWSRCLAQTAREYSVDLVMSSRGSGASPAIGDVGLGHLVRRLACPLFTVPVEGWTPLPAPSLKREIFGHKRTAIQDPISPVL
ncbi:MAG: universal stress protein [Bryobacteraceae bacterium]|nr:universal stress protein [Bryobacteraceae bacterium]